MGKLDSATKAFFSNPYVFADIFNYWLHDGEQVIDPEHLKEASGSLISFSSQRKKLIRPTAEMAELETRKLKSNEITRDLVKHYICKEDGKSVYAILAIEAQNDVDYSMAARAMIYDGRQYEKQLMEIRNQHERTIKQRKEKWTLRKFKKTDRLTPVITLIIYLGPHEWDGPRTLHDLLAPQDPILLKYTADYRLNLIEPFRLSEEKIEQFQSDMREVLLYIKASSNVEYLKRLAEEQRFRKVGISAARVINEVTKSNLIIDEEEEKIDMCKAIEDLKAISRAEGIAAGRSEGISIGRNEGISIGRSEGQGLSVLTFMKKSQCDLETAMEFFEIKTEERAEIARYVEANR